MTTLWSHDREIQEIVRKVPDPLSMKAGSGNETSLLSAINAAAAACQLWDTCGNYGTLGISAPIWPTASTTEMIQVRWLKVNLYSATGLKNTFFAFLHFG